MKVDLTLVIISLLSVVVAPTLLVVVNSRTRSREKAEDRDWQEKRDEQLKEDREEVRRAAAESAEAAQRSQAAIVEGTDKVVQASTQAAETLVASNKEVADHVAEASKAHDEKLEQIHTLVNSGMIRQMEITLAALESNLALRKVDWNGHTPSDKERDLVKSTEDQIAKQKQDIEELKAATKFADAAEDFRASRTQGQSTSTL